MLPPQAAVAADLIATNVREVRCVSLDHADAWVSAIRWALGQSPTPPMPQNNAQWYARQRQVGLACARLRERGYELKVGAYGPELSASSRKAIVEKVNSLIALCGGAETSSQICNILKRNKQLHDGMWLFGDRIPGIYEAKTPTVPYGWLFSLGLRHVGRPAKARKLEIAWGTAVSLAVDFAAAFDCQRYGPWEDTNLHPTAFWRVVVDSLTWRELFSLPQVPPRVLPILRAVLSEMISSQEKLQLAVDLDSLFLEIATLLQSSAHDMLTVRPKRMVQGSLPLLWQLARGEVGKVNIKYIDPFSAKERNQDVLILFERGQAEVVTLPCSMVAAAACEIVFRLIWKKLDSDRAASVVGATIERAVECACEAKATSIFPRKIYTVGSHRYEIDLATRQEDRIVLVEMKAKSLTAKARSGDMMAFLSDYTDSYLALLEQLARHEVNLRQGLTPLTSPGERTDDLRPLKIALSPLSYGPISDKMLASSLFQSIASAQFFPVQMDASAKEVTERFNQGVKQAMEQIVKVAPKRDGLVELFPYFMDVFWLDLGQLLYVLDRSSSAADAFTPLRAITFSTRDFWTEVAFADRQGLSAGKWRPAST